MKSFFERFFYSSHGKTDTAFIITQNGFRFSVLTPCLLRVEIQQDDYFCDQPTQTVVCRDFDRPAYQSSVSDDIMHIQTELCDFCFSLSQKKMTYIKLSDGRKIINFHKGNLKGTCRTLDGTSGRISLNEGVISKNGVAALDDSKTLIVLNDGRILPRENKETDLYYFAYGYNYRAAIADFFHLTGASPLIPRFALGNWWSRYKAYTQEEYLDLIDTFQQKNIPLTVATVDMDWHWVRVTEKFGKEARDKKMRGKTPQENFYDIASPGWTGYSWNTELFPSPEEFLKSLREKGLHVTLNLHPSSGCKFYEDAYRDFCCFMGIDPDTKQRIKFDITDPKFIEGYFRFLHLPHEKSGVDFWWIDWQQGKKTKIPGLDPLWALNHYHYLDNAKNGLRPLILSRFSGAGSHRYPLGFSGDTAQTWSALRFQPYFTANAANIGYMWWSHDIGGHHFGKRDDELYLRWVQFGVFSPVLRLHSTSNEFMGKEPWKYRADVEYYASEALRLRHRLIPYLYSLAYLSHTQGSAICEPMYYEYPKSKEAYHVPNQYAFGKQLLVCPITEKIDPKTCLAGTDVWIPSGRYTDIFTGRIYEGETRTRLYRDEASIPVLAKAGTILPLSSDPGNSWKNPKSLELVIYRGNSDFTLYEDDGESMAFETGACCTTQFNVRENAQTLSFIINPASGDLRVVPQKRNYLLRFADVCNSQNILVSVDDKPYSAGIDKKDHSVYVSLADISPASKCEIILSDISVRKNISVKEFRVLLFSKMQGSNMRKKRFTDYALKNKKTCFLPCALKGPLKEADVLQK